MSSTYAIGDYKVGIICALPKERTAVEAMLDEIHPSQVGIPGDDNVYTFGSFGKPGTFKHNVVVASLGAGAYGTVSAAQVAGDLKRSFPHLKYGFMVGIAGAMARPESREADIRLGDIVVGCANGVPSIIDYTRGKESAGGFDIRSELGEPPEALSRAVSALLSEHQLRGPTYLTHLADMLKRHKQYDEPRWENNYYNIPEAADILFESQPDKCVGEGDCGACLLEGRTVVDRKPRDLPHPPETLMSEKFVRIGRDGVVDYPVVFLGSIGSALTLMESSVGRDRAFHMVEQQRKAKLLCFEMEASGIVRGWPCLVIRGICDYADSHKNDNWQNFAASVAAAYTKDLLLRIPSATIESAKPISKILQDGAPSIGSSHTGTGVFTTSDTADCHQPRPHIRPNNHEFTLPPIDDREQLALNRQFIQAAGAGDLNLVRSLHMRGANINSSDGPGWIPTAIMWATTGYKNSCNTIQMFPMSAAISYHYTNLRRYCEVIRYLNANGLDWNRQNPETKLLIRQALEEDRY